MSEQEFQQAVQEFFDNGGKVEVLPYHGPRWNEVEPSKVGSIWAKGYTKAAVSGFATVDSVKDIT
jgi:hypothetical protein